VTASLVTVGASVLSRVIGSVREAVIAGFYGTSAEFDTFVLAFTVPEFLSFIIFAALPTAIIPAMRKTAESSTEDQTARESALFWKGLFAFAGILAVISLGIGLFRSEILHALAPELAAEQNNLGVRLIAILAAFVFFRGLESYFRGWQFKKKHFVSPALSPFLVNIIVLAIVLSLNERLDIEALAYGWLVSSIASCIYNGVFALLVVKPSFRVGKGTPSVSPLLKLTFAVAAIELISLIYPIVDRSLAARFLGEGQIAALRYAVFLAMLAPGVLVVTFSLASFPWISDYSVSEETDRLRKLYRESVSLIIFVMGLVAAGMVMFSHEIVRVAFQRGAFDETSLQLTVGPFRWYALGILLYSIFIYQMKFYYARKAIRRLGGILAVMLLVKVIASFILVGPMEHEGLALATSIAWGVGCGIMTYDLKHVIGLLIGDLVKPAIRVLLPLTIVILCWYGTSIAWPTSDGQTLLFSFVRLGLFALLGVFVYVALAVLFRSPEPKRVFDSVVSRFRSHRSNQK